MVAPKRKCVICFKPYDVLFTLPLSTFAITCLMGCDTEYGQNLIGRGDYDEIECGTAVDRYNFAWWYYKVKF
jgi:hypothetical protein